jgi:PAS domain S-box-containing protein
MADLDPLPATAMSGDRDPSLEELEKASALLRTVLDTSNDGIVVVDRQNRMTHYNRRLREIWRIPETVMTTGDNAQALSFVLDQLAEPEQFLENVEALNPDPHAESHDTLTFKDGRQFEQWSRPYAIDGEPIGRVWIYRDVTDKKKLQEDAEARMRIEKELRSAYQFVNAVVENIPNMIFVKDAEHLKFVRFNKAGEELLGYSQEELLGKSDQDFFPPSEAAFFISRDRTVLSTRRMLDIPEEPIETRAHGPRLLHTRKIPIFDDSGKPVYLLGISEDITEKKAAEELGAKLAREQISRKEMERAVHLRNEFISIAAHELRTPLTSLTMQIQLLQSLLGADGHLDPSKGPQAAELLHRIDLQVDRLARRVALLLDVSRIRAGRLNLDREPCNLGNLIEQVVERLEPDAQRAGSRIQLNLAPSIQGNWDPARSSKLSRTCYPMRSNSAVEKRLPFLRAPRMAWRCLPWRMRAWAFPRKIKNAFLIVLSVRSRPAALPDSASASGLPSKL